MFAYCTPHTHTFFSSQLAAKALQLAPPRHVCAAARHLSHTHSWVWNAHHSPPTLETTRSPSSALLEGQASGAQRGQPRFPAGLNVTETFPVNMTMKLFSVGCSSHVRSYGRVFIQS